MRATIAAGLLATLGVAEAEAGAFTLEEDETKLFVLGFASSGDGYFDRKGKRRARGDYRKRELQVFAEHGARDGLTLFGSTGLQKIAVEEGKSDGRRGLGRSEIGARARLWSDGAWIVSAQSSVVIAGARSGRGLAVTGETDDQIDLRGLVARSFALFGKAGFVDLAAGYRLRSGDPADEIRLDATLGIRPMARLLLLAQSFNQIGTARWSGPLPLKQRIHKLQAAALYDLTESLQIIGAAFVSPAGRDALDETGATLGLGLRF